MELAVLTITAIGIFLFSISYMKFAYEGFRHHVVTGLLALIPVINLIALPTLWDRTRGVLMIGLVGLIAAVVAWFAGADKAFEAVRSDRNTPIATTQNLANTNGATGLANLSAMQRSKETFLTLLPGKALYRLDFEAASPNQIRNFAGRIVRITSTDHIVTDGRIQNFTPSSVFIEQPGDGNIAYEMMLSNIKSVDVMVKRAAR
ncbi:MAG: hypothetical protein ACPG47_01545 [Leucothrix sp.]